MCPLSDCAYDPARFTAGVRYNDTAGSDSTVWSLSGTWEFNPSLFASASVGTSFLLPDIYQLYAVDPYDTHGNPNLKPEKSKTFTVGFAVELWAATVCIWAP
mgnify:CR=1 FL=1